MAKSENKVYKVIKTIENDIQVYSFCPESWEDNGILQWPDCKMLIGPNPQKQIDKMIIDACEPQYWFRRMPCIVKKCGCTYELAKEYRNQLASNAFNDTEDEER